MPFRHRIGLILLWLGGLLFALAAANKNEPYLTALRGTGDIALVATSGVVVFVLLLRGYWRGGLRDGCWSSCGACHRS